MSQPSGANRGLKGGDGGEHKRNRLIGAEKIKFSSEHIFFRSFA